MTEFKFTKVVLRNQFDAKFHFQKVEDVIKFQEKAQSLTKGCSLPMELALMTPGKPNEGQRRIEVFLNESTLYLTKLKQERKLMKSELEHLRQVLKNYLGEVARVCN